MNDNMLFDVILVISAMMLVISASFIIVAPSIGIESPVAPDTPSFPSINLGGNSNSTYTFDQYKNVTISTSPQTYDDFEPDKQVYTLWTGGIQVSRYGFPFWQLEPAYFMNGTKIINYIDSLTAQNVVDNAIGTNSTFIIDYVSTQYECYAQFTPLAGYATLSDSWNTGHGFNVRLYGNSYSDPDAITQTIRYLTFIGSVIAFVFYYIFYIFQMLGLILTVLGLSPVFAGIIVLVVTIFVGALLLYIKGFVSIGK